MPEPNRLFEIGQSLIEIFPEIIDHSARVIAGSVFRIEPNSRVVVRHCSLEIALRAVRKAAIVECGCELGIELECLVKICDRSVILALVVKCESAITK